MMSFIYLFLFFFVIVTVINSFHKNVSVVYFVCERFID